MLDLTNLANYQITKTSKTTKTSQILKLSDHSILNLTNYQITKSMNAISALYLGKLTLGWGEAQDEWLLLLWTQDISRTLWIVALFFGRFFCGCRISLTISGVSYPCAMCFCCGRGISLTLFLLPLLLTPRIFLTLQPASTRLNSFTSVLSPCFILVASVVDSGYFWHNLCYRALVLKLIKTHSWL